MLKALGYESLDALIDAAVPGQRAQPRRPRPARRPAPSTQVSSELRRLAAVATSSPSP